MCEKAYERISHIEDTSTKEFLKNTGVFIFPEEVKLGQISNPIYREFSASPAYLRYESEGIAVVILYACMYHSDLIKIGAWISGIPETKVTQFNYAFKTFLADNKFDSKLISTFD